MRYSVKPLAEDTRVFNVDSKIEVKDVCFQNRYSFMVAGIICQKILMKLINMQQS